MPSWEETLYMFYDFDKDVEEIKDHKFKDCLVYSGFKENKKYFVVISFEAGWIYDEATLDLYDTDFNKIKTLGYELC